MGALEVQPSGLSVVIILQAELESHPAIMSNSSLDSALPAAASGYLSALNGRINPALPSDARIALNRTVSLRVRR